MKRYVFLALYVILVVGSVVFEIILCTGLKQSGIEMATFSDELVISSRANDEYFDSTDKEMGLKIETTVSEPTKTKKGAYNYSCSYTIVPDDGNTFESGIVNFVITCTDKNGEEKVVTKDIDIMKNKRSGSFKLGINFVYEQKIKVETHLTSGRYLHKYDYIYHIEGGNSRITNVYYVNSHGLKFYFDNALSYSDGLKIGRNRFTLGSTPGSDTLYIPQEMTDKNGYVITEYNPMEVLIGNPANYKDVTTVIIDADIKLSDFVRSTMLEKFTNLKKVYIRSIAGTSKSCAKELGIKESTFTKNLKKGKYTHLTGYDVEIYVGSTNCESQLKTYFKGDPSFGSLTVSSDFGIEITSDIINNAKR